MSYKKIALRTATGLLAALLLYFAGVLVYGSLTDYQPEGNRPLLPIREASAPVLNDSVISLLAWNIGYAGLGAESDFFYEGGGFLTSGGKMVHTPKPLVEKNLEGILNLARSTQADFFLFQEVDSASRRSYFTDQTLALSEAMPGYGAWYGVNYLVDRVPVPLLEPWHAYGRTNSGLLTLSKYDPATIERVQLPGKYPWPNRLFQLDRCAMVARYPLNNDKELVLVNIHNAAHDKTGRIKVQQMEYLRTFFLSEYEKGNYVLAGGDWNQCPPFFEFDSFMPGKATKRPNVNIDGELMPDQWRWMYDPAVPTNRRINKPYTRGDSFVTTIDFFLVSPNIQVRKVRVIDQDFQFSDHQPVWMEVELIW